RRGWNSAFHHLSAVKRERLAARNTERSCFCPGWCRSTSPSGSFSAAFSLGAYVHSYHSSAARENGLDPWWVGAFNAVSTFNNSSMSLLDANMTAFGTSVFMLLSMSLLILAGNTCYPVVLRLTISILY